MPAPGDTQPGSWHRHFGATANNSAWAMLERSTEEIDPRALLNAAHAAAWHWHQVGTELNQLRALMLLAAAHARAGSGKVALEYANEMRRVFLQLAGIADWELAFVYVVHAHAAASAGAKDAHEASLSLADAAVERIADAEDKRIVNAVFCNVPRP